MPSAPSELNKSLDDELVRAGAGAGKTTALVERVMALVAHYKNRTGKWPRLVVTTFTRKATQELRERLTLKAIELQDLDLLDYCRSRSRLHISTIHGVMALFLRRYGHLLDLDPSYTILTSTGARSLRRQVLREVLMNVQVSGELLELYALSRLETMLLRYVEAKAENPNLLPLNEAEILQMQSRLAAELASQIEDVANELAGSTVHPGWLDYSKKLLSLAACLKQSWDEAAWLSLQDVWAQFPNKPRKGPQTALPGDLEERVAAAREKIKKFLTDAGNRPQTARSLGEQAEKFKILAEAFAEEFTSRKKRLGQMEMSDLELSALQAIRDQEGVAQAFASDWDHWLIDEYQDTSPVQVELLSRLVHNRPRYIVGDPQQSIYLFRGARSEVFMQEERALTEKGLTPQFKMRNYRSHPSLLTFMNDFFASLDAGFQAMDPRTEDFEPERDVATFFAARASEEGFARQEEYAAMAHHIHQLVERQKAALSDICILARKNRTLLEIAQFLKELGYPTHVHASRGYSARREVRDALALLKFLAQPSDNENLIALLRSPWCRVRDEVLAHHLSRGGPSFWQQLSSGPLRKHPAIRRLKQAREEAGQEGLSLAWERALIRFCFVDLSLHHDATGRREANLWKLVSSLALAERRPGFKILEFINQASAVQSDTEAADEGDAVTAVEPNVINLMTVHAAKGLQRRHVMIPHCDEIPRTGRRPDFAFDPVSGKWSVPIRAEEEENSLYSPLAANIFVESSRRELEEQDRLLYVAVTRAEESVYLSWTGEARPKSWAGRWRWKTDQAGRFAKDKYHYRVLEPVGRAPGFQRRGQGQSLVRSPWVPHPGPSLPPSLSVSELLENEAYAGRVRTENIQPEDLSQKLEKAVLGTALHRLLERLRIQPDQDLSKLAALWFPGHVTTVLEALNFVRDIAKPPMDHLFRRGHAEWGFQVRLGASILEGQIDLWGEDKGTIWVVDYKSGDPRYLEKAFAQLEIYATALRRFGHEQPIQLAVIYPLEKRVETRPFSGVGMKTPLNP